MSKHSLSSNNNFLMPGTLLDHRRGMLSSAELTQGVEIHSHSNYYGDENLKS
jgi:hypothetical protein